MENTALSEVGGNRALMDKFATMGLSTGKGYLNEISAFPILTEQEERELAIEYRKTGNRNAAWALICTHLRQVVSIARGYRGYGLPEADLIEEGNIGLMRAVKGFDPDRKVRLSTYATHWIKASIGEYIIRNWKMMKVASTSAQRKLFYRLRSITGRLGRRLTKEDARQIADDLEVRSKDVLEMEKRMLLPEVPFENNSLVDDEFDMSPSTTLTADDGAHAEQTVVADSVEQIKHKALQEAMESLDERERAIMEARALTESGKDTKLRELADSLGISTERVRQIEKRAMAKVKNHVLKSCAHLFA